MGRFPVFPYSKFLIVSFSFENCSVTIWVLFLSVGVWIFVLISHHQGQVQKPLSLDCIFNFSSSFNAFADLSALSHTCATRSRVWGLSSALSCTSVAEAWPSAHKVQAGAKLQSLRNLLAHFREYPPCNIPNNLLPPMHPALCQCQMITPVENNLLLRS